MAYSQIENRFLDSMAEAQFPTAPEPMVEEPVQLAAGPSDTVSDAGAPVRRVGRAGVPYRPPSMKDITEPLGGLMDMGAATIKGVTQGFTGLPGDLEGLARTVINMMGGNVGENTVMPTTDEVKAWLDKFPMARVGDGNNPYESIGEVGAPGGQIKAGKAVLKGAKALAPTAGEMVIDTMGKLGTPVQMFAVPIEKFPKVASASAAKVDNGAVRLSDKVTKGQVLQLAPDYRVKVVNGYKPEGKTQNIPNAVNPGNFDEVNARLNTLTEAFPDPLESPERFSTMLANVYNSTEVPMPPRWMIENVNDMDKWSSWFGTMTKGQIDEASRGFSVVDKFKQVYGDGTASVDTTGRLMMWAMLSRRASAYPHESGFLDLAEAITPLIKKASSGEFTQADIDAGLALIKQTLPEGSPGNMVTSNANDFIRIFLPKMSEKLPDGRSKLQALHDMIADPNLSGPQIRREFFHLAQDVGIKNKVLSFALLVSGRTDVMVLDRIQINRLFAGGEKIYDDVAHLFDGGPGLAIYEGLERSLGKRIQQLYDRVGRGNEASLGRYHWESWVLSSGQEVAHPTLETIVKAAKGEAAPFANVPVKEGRMHERGFGVSYERMPDGSNRFVFPTADGGQYEFTKPQLDELFGQVMDRKNGIVPKDFPGVKYFSKDTLEDGSPNPYFGKPWYSWPGVDRNAIDQLAATIGTKLDSPSRTGAVETAVGSEAANRPVRTSRTPGQSTSVSRGRQAPQSGAN